LPHPNPIHPKQNPDIHDMHFGIFNTCIQQHLLVNNAIATLNNIRVTAEVAHYWSAMLEFRDARRELAAAKNKILHVQEK